MGKLPQRFQEITNDQQDCYVTGLSKGLTKIFLRPIPLRWAGFPVPALVGLSLSGNKVYLDLF